MLSQVTEFRVLDRRYADNLCTDDEVVNLKLNAMIQAGCTIIETGDGYDHIVIANSNGIRVTAAVQANTGAVIFEDVQYDS